MDTLKDFLSGRVFNPSRSNVKEVLNSAGLPGILKTVERIKICIACRGLSITDNFWIKNDDERLTFQMLILGVNTYMMQRLRCLYLGMLSQCLKRF